MKKQYLINNHSFLQIILCIIIGSILSIITPSTQLYTKEQWYDQYPLIKQEREHSYHHYYTIPDKSDITIHPTDLLVWWRFDITAKYLYVYYYINNIHTDWAKKLYTQHLRVWSNIAEWDQSRIGIDEYLTDFHQVINTIQKNGFDPSLSKIRIDRRYYPCEGSHRIGASLFFNTPVTCYYDKNPYKNMAPQSTATFFQEFNKYVQTGLDPIYLDQMALVYQQLKPTTSLLLAWSLPDTISTYDIRRYILKQCTIVYHTKKPITPAGLRTLLHLITADQKTVPEQSSLLDLHLFLIESHNQDTPLTNEAIDDAFNDSNIMYALLNKESTDMIAPLLLNPHYQIPLTHEWLKNNADKINNTIAYIVDWLTLNAINHENSIIHHWETGDNGSCRPVLWLHNNHVPPHHKTIMRVELYSTQSTIIDTALFNPQNFFYYQGLKWHKESLPE